MTIKVELNNTRQKITETVNILGEAVGKTMGPGGENVLLETQAGMAIITKDGVTVANACLDFEDPEMKLVANIIKQAADKTNREAGDGTTTATVLTREIYNQGNKLIAAGFSANQLKKEMDLAKDKILANLDSQTQKINNTNQLETLEHICSISLNGDTAMSKLIAKAVNDTGIHGIVKVQENSVAKDEMDKTQGMQFNAGWMSQFFADRDGQKVVLENCAILITSHKLNSLHQLAALEKPLEHFMKKGIPVLFIASECSGPFLTNLVANQKKGSLKNCATRPPYYGNTRKEFFTDLAILTSATVIEAEEKMDLEMVKTEHFGYAKRVEITADHTTITQPAAKPELLQHRINTLKDKLETIEKDKDLDKIAERLAKLTDGVVLIKVARQSQVEMEERKHRIEDALNAAKAALEQGYVSGGGAALYYAAKDLNETIPGERALRMALEGPAKRICYNAGHSDKIFGPMDNGEVGKTIDAISGKYVDAYSHGIIDPAKVTKAAVSNAISVASTLLTTNVIISKIPDKNPVLPYQMY